VPLPRLPLVVSASANVATSSTPVAGTATTAHADSMTIDADYAPGPSWRVHAIEREVRSGGDNLGVDAITRPEAGAASDLVGHDLRLTVDRLSASIASSTRITVTATDTSMRANSDAPGVAVAGVFVGGGAAIASSRGRRAQWRVKQLLRGGGAHPWSVGAEVAGAVDRAEQTPNPHGLVQFDSLSAYVAAVDGAPTGTLLATRGDGSAAVSTLQMSPFVQRALVRTGSVQIDAGVRADWYSTFGGVVSPRLSGAIHRGDWTLSGGAGVFARGVANAVLLRVAENDGAHLRPYVEPAVAFPPLSSGAGLTGNTIRSTLAASVAAPRETLWRASLERELGNFTAAVEYSGARDAHLLGSDRTRSADDWIDTLDSNRSATTERVHLQLRRRAERQLFAAHAEWTHAYDDTDGPFSFPQRPGAIAAEWARRAGIPSLSTTLADTLRLKGDLSVTVSHVWRSSAPFNITTGLDPLGDGLFNDRGGRPRNSGGTPAYGSLSIHAFRRWPVPHTFGAHDVDVSLQADNVLNRLNVMSVASVAGSPTFGSPLAAWPGRSIRLFFNVR